MQKDIQFHSLSVKDSLRELNSRINGLTDKEVSERLSAFGRNKIPEKKQMSKIIVLIRQFKNLMVYILLVAAIISFFLDHVIDVYIIFFVILANATIGYYQESKAENAIRSLKKMIVQQADVLRNGELIRIPAENLVPGDILSLEEGDRISADARLLEIKNFRTVESSLTGESLPIDKSLKQLPEKTPLADQKNMVFLGTFVASGQAKAIVSQTGAKTSIGKLARSIEEIKPRKSHFQEKSNILAKYMALIAFSGAILTFLIGFFFRDFTFPEIFIFTIASLVSGIPEGLPAVLAIVLAIGSFRMAKRNAIIREKYATETLGIIDTIITDKTGTLTKNTMTVQSIYLPEQKQISVSGSGWNPKGDFFQNEKRIIPLENRNLAKLLHISATCNNARLIKEENSEEKFSILGDPTEAAMIVLAEKAGLKKSVLLQKEKRLDDMAFNPGLKYRASLSTLTEKGSKKEISVIGAPEALLKQCTKIMKNGRKAKLLSKDISKIDKKINEFTGSAKRVLAIAYKEVPSSKNELNEKDAFDLIFIGLIGMSDPPREGVKEAVTKAKKAGIRLLMATGDHKNTAIAIAKEIGLVSEEKKGFPLALTGSELQQLSDKDFEIAVKNVSVFARLTPESKLKIARTLQKNGHIIAMTGDGVNDAPALKQADIGISMGIIGTDVARESSGMVLADDNFASIVNAVEEGRTVFTNTRQTSFFLVSTSIAEDTTIISTMLLGMPLPLLPTQILWLNLVTGGATTIAIATEQSHHDNLGEKPRNKNENILSKELIPFILTLTIPMLVLTILIFNYYLPDESMARTSAFAVMSFTQLFSMLTLRSLKNSLSKIGYLTNKYITGAFFLSALLALIAIYMPFFQNIFQFSTIPLKHLGVIFLLSSITLWAGEIYKKVRKDISTPLK